MSVYLKIVIILFFLVGRVYQKIGTNCLKLNLKTSRVVGQTQTTMRVCRKSLKTELMKIGNGMLAQLIKQSFNTHINVILKIAEILNKVLKTWIMLILIWLTNQTLLDLQNVQILGKVMEQMIPNLVNLIKSLSQATIRNQPTLALASTTTMKVVAYSLKEEQEKTLLKMKRNQTFQIQIIKWKNLRPQILIKVTDQMLLIQMIWQWRVKVLMKERKEDES